MNSYEGEVLVLLKAVFEFVLLKHVCKTLQVYLMQFVNVLTGWTGSLDNRNRLPH